MARFALPPRRLMTKAFLERGRSDVVLIDVFPVADGERLHVVFEASNSPWRQGIFLWMDKYIVVNGLKCPSCDLWQDTAPETVPIECHTKSGLLHLYNIWADDTGRHSQAWTSGMLVEDLPTGRRYRCNDYGFDTNFDKLIFRIERVSGPE